MEGFLPQGLSSPSWLSSSPESFEFLCTNFVVIVFFLYFIVEHRFQSRNVFVKHLPKSVDDVALRGLFTEFGSIVSAKVMVDPLSGEHQGYG